MFGGKLSGNIWRDICPREMSRGVSGKKCLGKFSGKIALINTHGVLHLSRYVTSHPGQLSLAIPSWVSTMSTNKRAVMPCCCGVKAGMVHVWVEGKTLWSPCYTQTIWTLLRCFMIATATQIHVLLTLLSYITHTEMYRQLVTGYTISSTRWAKNQQSSKLLMNKLITQLWSIATDVKWL